MIRFLICGLIRDRSRSLFPILMVAAGALLTVWLYSYVQGAMGDMVDSNARFDAGHVKIMTRAYHELADQMPNDLALLDNQDMLNKLSRDYPDMIWTPRIKFGGLIDIPDAQGQTRSQGPVFGMGIDLHSPDSPEIELLKLKQSLVRGRMPQKPGEMLISETFSQKLGLSIGETATLISSTMNGSMSIHNFSVAGTVRFGMVALDRSSMIADIEDVRLALDMVDATGEIVGFTRDLIYADDHMVQLAQRFNQSHHKSTDEFAPVMVSLSDQTTMIRNILKMADSIGEIAVGVFVFVMSIVLWNAGLMNGIRRYGEIGVRLAMGEPKGAIYRSMIFESACIGLAGSALGTALGLGVSYWMQYYGLDFSGVLQKSTILISSVIHARVTITSYYIGFIPGLFASVLGTMFAGIAIYKRQTSQLFKELEV
jgi:putative ABC transport system permease protein